MTDLSQYSDEELEAMAAQSAPASEPMPQKPLSEWTDEELEAYAAEPTPAPAQPAAHSPRMTREERIAANDRAIETARSQEEPGFLSAAGEAIAEGAKGAARAVKSIGSGIVGMASGAARLAGTPVRAVTGWEGLHRLADTIDSSYENFGRDALMSEYGENPDGWGYALGRAGEKVAGVAGSLAALGGVGKAVGAAGTALKAAGHAKTAAAVANTLPLMFGNDAAVRAYDTARANRKSKGESAALAGLNGAIHFLGFKAFENKALNKMLGMPAEMEGLMPKWAGEAAEAGGQSFSSLARGVRNGMIKYTLAERGKGALRAGGIMGLQNFLSDPVMQVAEGASIDDIDFSRALKAGAEGVGEGALMEGALGAAAVLKSPAEARKFIADKYFRGKDYKVMGADGKMHDEPGLLETSEGRMMLMKQNPAATERVLDIVEHGGTPRPAELDAAFLPPDMTAEELKKFASDWRNDLKPYVEEAWAADAPRQTAAPDAASAKPGRNMLSPEEAQTQQKAANDAAERQKVADRRAAADSMMLDFESWNRLYADGKTDLNFDEWRAAGKPGVIEANLTPKTEEAPTSETRTDEAPAKPEQGEVVVPAAGAEARSVEGAEARPEAADARVVKPQTAENRTEATQEGAGARPASETATATPAPTKPAEAASRASGAEGAGAQPPSVPAEPPKSNRLRRADGTDPLAEKNPAPKTVRKAVDKISLAISNRTETGVITPDEADGIVRGIAESPETKHNRYRDFFNPLENDAKWHESLGLDAESAKNIRDAVDRVKTDSDLKKWFPQVDAAVKKANDGRLSRKDAAPLFGKISEGLEKAERMGLSETANRLREAAEVIRPVAETVEQGDVNKFNYSTKGKKLNNRLGGTDKRRGKTVSLDTKNGTVDVGATGQGGALGGNRHLIIDSVNGDELTVTMKDAAGKTLATRKMSRAQWSALSQGAVATDGDPANPQKGDLIRMSRSDATDAPQSWTPEAKKPLERVAHALRNVVTVGGKKLKVSFADRPAEADGQTRKSISGIFTGTAADYANRSRQGGVDDGPSLKKIGSGEGSQVYGWGLYGSTVRGVAEGYAMSNGGKFGKIRWRKNGEEPKTQAEIIATDWLGPANGNPKKAIKLIKDRMETVKALGLDVKPYLEAIKDLRDHGDAYSISGTHLYEETFFTDRAPGDESHLLKWYEPVSKEQFEVLRKAGLNVEEKSRTVDGETIRRMQIRKDGKLLLQVEDASQITGEDLYRLVADSLGSPQAASEFLARAGIDGVKYPVDSYGGNGVKDGDKAGWDYVSFRDDNIRVDHKWTDGELRYMRNADGVTVGEYDAANGEIRLYPGATVADVVHEFTHPLVDFARAEANAGRGELLGKINQIIDAERETWEKPVRDAYKGKSNETILEEIFTHAMGEKGADLFGKSTKTLQGRRWYNRLWEAIKGVWQDFATKMGWNKADLRGLERMSPEDAAQKILSEMAKGRNFGDAATGGEGTAEARRIAPPPAPTTKDIADWLEGKDDVRRKWRRALQDKNIGIRDVEEKLGITDKNESAYYAKDRAFGKNEHELTVLQKQEVEPIVEKIHKSGGDLGLFSAYLYARHAGERNAVLKAERGVDNGSGMNDAQAKTIFDAVDRLGLRAAFEDAAKDVWAMNRKYLQRRVDAGRMTQDEADFLTKRYQHYVPLRTDMTNEELDIFNSTTGGWKRNETMTAEGRKSAADDPLAFSIVQNEQAIRASNANEVRRRWAGVVRRSKGELGEIVDGVNKGTAKWAFTFGDGETVETGSPMKLASERDDIILFKENGQLKAIKMKPGEHGRGIELARAVTDKDVAKFNEHLDWIPSATRWMSAMRTQYVPTFIVRNLKADNLEVMLNVLSERGLRGENGRSGGVAFFGKFLKNEVSVAKGVREYFKTGKSSDRYVQEAVENGLLTGGGMAAEGFTETARRLYDTLQALRERPKIIGGTLKAAKDTISLLNACAEYNTRMGVYKTLREEGMSVADAVSYARDVTVNFNRKGYLTPYTNAAFMFSNAAIQGMGRAFKSMGSEHGKGVIAGLFMVGVAQALLDDWLGHDDEKEKTGGADSRNMTEYDKEHSLGIALPTGHRVKTGIRNPWALPMYAGRKTVELLKGITSGEQAMKDLANAVGGFVTEPVGGNGFGSKAEFLQTIAPTIIDPFVQWGTGKDYRGQDRLKKSFDKTAPQSWNGKERTPEAYKLIAQGLNALTGGNEFRKGWVDSAPEDWQLLTETVFGGVLTDLNNVVKAGGHAVDVARGKPAAQIARDIPFVRDTFTNLPENSNRYYAALEDYERDKAEFKKTTPERRREMKADKPYLFMGKSLLDGQIERVKKYMHLERGEVKVGQKWVEPKTPRTEEQKEEWRKKRLALQAQILERLGK